MIIYVHFKWIFLTFSNNFAIISHFIISSVIHIHPPLSLPVVFTPINSRRSQQTKPALFPARSERTVSRFTRNSGRSNPPLFSPRFTIRVLHLIDRSLDIHPRQLARFFAPNALRISRTKTDRSECIYRTPEKNPYRVIQISLPHVRSRISDILHPFWGTLSLGASLIVFLAIPRA